MVKDRITGSAIGISQDQEQNFSYRTGYKSFMESNSNSGSAANNNMLATHTNLNQNAPGLLPGLHFPGRLTVEEPSHFIAMREDGQDKDMSSQSLVSSDHDMLGKSDLEEGKNAPNEHNTNTREDQYSAHRLTLDFPDSINPGRTPAAASGRFHAMRDLSTHHMSPMGMSSSDSSKFLPESNRCPFPGCMKIAKDRKTLRKHLLTHRDKQFICDFEGCNKKFYERAKLKRHHIVHTGEKPFVCPYDGCGKKFGYKANLKTHMRTHTGVKPYVCTYPGCNRRFAQASNRNSHVLTHQKESPLGSSKSDHPFPTSSVFPMLSVSTGNHSLISPQPSPNPAHVVYPQTSFNGLLAQAQAQAQGNQPKSPSFVDLDMLLRFSPHNQQVAAPGSDFWLSNVASGINNSGGHSHYGGGMNGRSIQTHFAPPTPSSTSSAGTSAYGGRETPRSSIAESTPRSSTSGMHFEQQPGAIFGSWSGSSELFTEPLSARSHYDSQQYNLATVEENQ